MSVAAPTPVPLVVKFSDDDVTDMRKLLKASPLPTVAPVLAKEPWELGIDLDYLKELKASLEDEKKWSSKKLEEEINKFQNYTVDFQLEDGSANEKLTLHYVHARSQRQDAIPLILLHGWPGEHRIMSLSHVQ